jgi:hypothetical protein
VARGTDVGSGGETNGTTTQTSHIVSRLPIGEKKNRVRARVRGVRGSGCLRRMANGAQRTQDHGKTREEKRREEKRREEKRREEKRREEKTRQDKIR